MEIFKQAVFGFLCSVAFAVLSNVPRRALLKGGLLGMVAWVVYLLAERPAGNVFLASLLCCLVLSLGGMLAARADKQPLTIYLVPGLVPVVPGITFSMAFNYLVQQEYAHAATVFRDVAYTAVGLVCGLAVATFVYRLLLLLFKPREDAV